MLRAESGSGAASMIRHAGRSRSMLTSTTLTAAASQTAIGRTGVTIDMSMPPMSISSCLSPL